MKNPKKLKKVSIIMLIMLTVVNAICVLLFVIPKDLAVVKGPVLFQSKYQEQLKEGPFNAVLLSINGCGTNFVIQDTKAKAYRYLSDHFVVGKQAEITYDAKSSSRAPGLAFDIYKITIDGNALMSKSETNQIYLTVLLIFGVAELFFAGLYFYAKRLANQK